MTKEVTKPEKIALCRECRGTGMVVEGKLLKKSKPCPNCDGSGRVWVSYRMTLAVRPYKD